MAVIPFPQKVVTLKNAPIFFTFFLKKIYYILFFSSKIIQRALRAAHSFLKKPLDSLKPKILTLGLTNPNRQTRVRLVFPFFFLVVLLFTFSFCKCFCSYVLVQFLIFINGMVLLLFLF